MRVLQRLDDVGGIGVAGVHLRRGAARRVVAKGDEIDGVFEDLVIARLFRNRDPFFPEHPRGPHRIGAAGLDIDKEQVFAVLLQRHPYIFRLAGVRVEITAGQHTADLILRVNLMGDFRRQRAGHQLVMRGLILHLLLVFTLFKHQPGAGVGAVQHDVDFIKGEPVFHQAVKSFKAGAGVVAEKIHHFAVAPGAVLHHQMHRHVKMAQGDQRLDTVLFALLEQ